MKTDEQDLPYKASLLGVGVSVVDYDAAVTSVVAAAQRSQSFVLTAADVNEIMQAFIDPVFAAVLNSFQIVTPDGQPLRWGMRWTRQALLTNRVYGPTLMLRVCERAAQEGLGVYLYGGRRMTMLRLQNCLLEKFPSLRVLGSTEGRFRALSVAEQQADAESITTSGAKIVLVGMGCPRQEWWMHHMRHRLDMPLLGVGAAFDFHAGVVRQAPPWMQARGLEWLFRLTQEPARLWRRYLLVTPQYLPLIALQALRLRDYELATNLEGADARICPG